MASYLDQDLDSIVIVTSDGVEIEMNKNQLSSISVIFREMLADINYGKISKIRIKEDNESFSAFIRILQGDDVILHKFRQMLEMYKMSKRYKVEKIEKIYKKKIMTFDREFATEVYELAVKFLDAELQFHCWKLFREFTDDDVKGERFIHSSKITMKKFVTCPIYMNLTESALFFGVYRWARMKILNKGVIPNPQLIRKEMDRFLPYIRLLILTEGELEKVFETAIFNDDEINSIRNCRSGKKGVCIASYSSQCRRKRMVTDSSYSFFMCYHNERPFGAPNQVILTAKDEFFSEFTVYELCFLHFIKLPVSYNYISKRLVTIKFYHITENHEIDILTLEEDCNHTGEINLTIPQMLTKSYRYKLKIKFISTAFKPNKRIYINSDVKYYAHESEEPRNFINRIYFRINLFF